MSQIHARFIIGGAVVSAFAIIGDVLKPKSFAGLLPGDFPSERNTDRETPEGEKESLGLKGPARGRSAASIDAAGSAIGSVGLFAFALVVSQFMAGDRAWIVLAGATVSWLGVSVAVWQIRKAL